MATTVYWTHQNAVTGRTEAAEVIRIRGSVPLEFPGLGFYAHVGANILEDGTRLFVHPDGNVSWADGRGGSRGTKNTARGGAW